VTVLDHTAALASVATGGAKVTPTGINRVYDSEGKLIYSAKPEHQQVLMPEVASQLLKMLMAVVTEGTGRRAQISGYQVAGKTGTSEDVKDVWFVGFTPTIACGVWTGRDDNKPLRAGSGGTLCAPVFKEIVLAALKYYPGERTFRLFEQERDADSRAERGRNVRVVICAESGMLATDFCPVTYSEIVPADRAPKRRCPLHREELQPVLICTVSGKLATPNCPAQTVVTKTLPKSAIPTEACDIHTPAPPTEEVESQPQPNPPEQLSR
jgi:penicillin-binding protein 1A